jgi:hypothetical protein
MLAKFLTILQVQTFTGFGEMVLTPVVVLCIASGAAHLAHPEPVKLFKTTLAHEQLSKCYIISEAPRAFPNTNAAIAIRAEVVGLNTVVLQKLSNRFFFAKHVFHYRHSFSFLLSV